ncbi:hypothetical protein K450DRAFT_250321 [Umbelopsis ramanniana AG]|uniref:Uncharacterized protein n=1 Tax=Umbelopsis ramanniana AG TaxID=1314678 RepID=A0AAD5E903_UMBRA|nr:uncharacterized protein K450DRAFT_250321 [Umbelopsis ramanniana AG]KAI8577840.1 hypothetical protein K450DRAFT_250321 [Umbelopsis ramanniana AG]
MVDRKRPLKLKNLLLHKDHHHEHDSYSDDKSKIKNVNKLVISPPILSPTRTSSLEYLLSPTLYPSKSMSTHMNSVSPRPPVRAREAQNVTAAVDVMPELRPRRRYSFSGGKVKMYNSPHVPTHRDMDRERARKMRELEDRIVGRRQSTVKLTLTPRTAV